MPMNRSSRLVGFTYVTLFVYSIASSVSITGPVMPLYVKSLGVSVIGWSVLVAALAVGMFLSEWVWGSLGDRTDRRLLMLLSVLALSGFSLLYTVHSLLPFFVVLQFATGALIVAIGPLTRSYISDESPGASMGLYVSLWWMFFLLGRVVGPLLGAYIAQTWAFEYSFWASSLISVLLAVFILVSFPREMHRRQAPKPNMLGSLKLVLGRRSARFLFLSALCMFMEFSLISSFLPLYAYGEIKMSTVAVGVLVSSVSGAQLVAMPLVGWLSDKFGRKRTALVGCLASSCLFLLYFAAGSGFQVLIVSIAIGLAFSGTALLLAMVPDVTPATMQATTMGVYGSFEDLGSITAPLLFGFVWSVFGPVYIFAATSIIEFMAVLLIHGIKQTTGKKAWNEVR